MIKGIDVSVHQGDIDWEKITSDSIGFAILRAGNSLPKSNRKQNI